MIYHASSIPALRCHHFPSDRNVFTIRGGQQRQVDNEAAKLLVEKFLKEIVALFQQDNQSSSCLI